MKEQLPKRKGRSRTKNHIEDSKYLAGLFDGRGFVEVARYVRKGRYAILPRIGSMFDLKEKPMAEALRKLIGGRMNLIKYKGKDRIRVTVTGIRGGAKLADRVLPYMHNPVQSWRFRVVQERANKPKPTVCTAEEAAAPSGKLAEVFFKGCPKHLD